MRGVKSVAVIGLACALALGGCASRPSSDPPSASAASAARSQTEILTAPRYAMIIHTGDGPVICLGAVLDSYPPQCTGGPAVLGWDWADWDGAFESAASTRWGDFTVSGRFDPDAYTFTATEIAPWDPMTAPQGPEAARMFATPCATPAGGWRVLDPEKTTEATMNEAFARAAELAGYAASWVDRSRAPTPAPDATPLEQFEFTQSYPDLTIVNVSIDGDVVAGEQALREVWGGMLCVSGAAHSAAELHAIADELLPRMEPGGRHFLGVGIDAMAGSVGLSVVYDDGTLQQQMDDEYGAGMVVVSSAFRAAA